MSPNAQKFIKFATKFNSSTCKLIVAFNSLKYLQLLAKFDCWDIRTSAYTWMTHSVYILLTFLSQCYMWYDILPLIWGVKVVYICMHACICITTDIMVFEIYTKRYISLKRYCSARWSLALLHPFLTLYIFWYIF